MTVLNALIEIELPYVSTLKGRRAVLNSIKERLKRYNLSLLDVSDAYPKRAILAIIFLSFNDKSALQQLQKIEDMLERYFPEAVFEIGYEIV